MAFVLAHDSLLKVSSALAHGDCEWLGLPGERGSRCRQLALLLGDAVDEGLLAGEAGVDPNERCFGVQDGLCGHGTRIAGGCSPVAC